MRTIVALVFMSLCLSFSCASDEPAPGSDVTAAEGLGQVEQAVCSSESCDCPLGTRCGASGNCEGYAVWGPDTSPLKCVSSCQCQQQYSPGWFCHMDAGSYGHCRPYPP